jgi:enamine deaminase RidA (YjgF/YER057c/UK114 family)
VAGKGDGEVDMKRKLITSAALLAAAPAAAEQARPPMEHFGAPQVGGQPLPFSSAVRVGDILYLSGQIGIGADGRLPEGIEAQTRQTMENIGAVLRSAGGGARRGPYLPLSAAFTLFCPIDAAGDAARKLATGRPL